jgi:DNA repair exonuclease SbcCD ATPase subunit
MRVMFSTLQQAVEEKSQNQATQTPIQPRLRQSPAGTVTSHPFPARGRTQRNPASQPHHSQPVTTSFPMPVASPSVQRAPVAPELLRQIYLLSQQIVALQQHLKPLPLSLSAIAQKTDASNQAVAQAMEGIRIHLKEIAQAAALLGKVQSDIQELKLLQKQPASNSKSRSRSGSWSANWRLYLMVSLLAALISVSASMAVGRWMQQQNTVQPIHEGK